MRGVFMSVELKPHNQTGYENAKKIYETENECCIVHPTSTGKSYIALKFVEDFIDKKILYIAPRRAILHQIKDDAIKNKVYVHDNFQRMTYQAFTRMTEEQIKALDVDFIVIDEFHHAGSDRWGPAIRTLIETHPGAKILGLSATPIRYFDNNRDMTDELFNGKVASEITLEEAIERGILKGFDYIATTYTQEVEDSIMDGMMENSIVPEHEKEKFESLREELRVAINENIVNLPDMLGDVVTQKSGKYVFFCKNIEEKKEMIKMAEQMFSKVNQNIKVYDVDSTYTDIANQRTMRAFRNASSDDGVMKIIYSVDMLVEGIQVPDLAGGFTTKPTKSPRVAFQEVGRILTTEDGIRPVFVDFVDSFRQLEIIQNISKNEDRTRASGSKKETQDDLDRKIRVIDHTLKIADIVSKMEMIKRDKTTLEQKIAIIEEYQQTNDYQIISGKTVYNGYPVGPWILQLRSAIRKNKIIDKALIKRLDDVGALKSDFTTIEERANVLCEIAQKYPEYMIHVGKYTGFVKNFMDNLADPNVKADCEFFNDNYKYVAHRMSDGKLPAEIQKMLTEGGVGGLFFNAQSKSNPILKFEKADARTKKFVKQMIKKYGTLEEFEKNYIFELATNPYFKKPSDIFVTNIDISSRNLMANESDMKFRKALVGEDSTPYKIINSRYIYEMINSLPYDKAQLLESRFGMNGKREKTYAELGVEYGLSKERIRQIEASSLRNFRSPQIVNKIDLGSRIGDLYLFLNRFIKEYGIYKRDEIPEVLRNRIMKEMDYCSDIYQEMLSRGAIIRENADNSEIIELLRNHYGEQFSTGGITTHFMGGHSPDITCSKVKDAQKLYYAIAIASIDKKNKEIVERQKRREYVKERINQQYKDLSEKIGPLINKKNITMTEILKTDITALKEFDKVKMSLMENGLSFGMSNGDLDDLATYLDNEKIRLSSINNLPISQIDKNVLNAAGINVIKDLEKFSYEDLQKINVGIEENKTIDDFIVGDSYIGALNFSGETYEWLCKNNISMVSDLLKDNGLKLLMIRNTDRAMFDEIMTKTNALEDVAKFSKSISENKKTTTKSLSTDMNVKDMGLSTRAYNCLRIGGIDTAFMLMKKTNEELMSIRNMGQKCLEEVIEKREELKNTYRTANDTMLIEALGNMLKVYDKYLMPVKIKDRIFKLRFT